MKTIKARQVEDQTKGEIFIFDEFPNIYIKSLREKIDEHVTLVDHVLFLEKSNQKVTIFQNQYRINKSWNYRERYCIEGYNPYKKEMRLSTINEILTEYEGSTKG